jgi:hypothetical protein
MFKDDSLDNYVNLPEPNASIEFFEAVRRLSEEHWAAMDINKRVYGFQIQRNTKWRIGLTDIFHNIYNVSDFESNPADAKSVKFWLEQKIMSQTRSSGLHLKSPACPP